jgi:hypothetical protein
MTLFQWTADRHKRGRRGQAGVQVVAGLLTPAPARS